MRFFIKDIEFYKALSNRVKKKFIYLFVFIFIYLFFNINNIGFNRLIVFLLFFFILLLWKFLIEICCYFFLENDKLKDFIQLHENLFNYLIKFLLFIQKWKNPVLIFFLYLDNLLLNVLRQLIYIFKIKYKKDLTEFWLEKLFFVYYLILNIMFGPLKIIFGFFYTALRTIIEVSFSFFFIIRIIGFLLSILIFSDLLNLLYNKLGFFYLILFVYLFLVIINMIIKYIERDFEYLKIQYIKMFICTDYLIYLRNNSTLIGFFLLSINFYKIILIERKYIDVTSSYLKTELEEGFYKYWEHYKRNTWFNTLNAWYEIRNRPSYYLYLNLLAWLNISPIANLHALNAITNIIYIKYKAVYLNIDFPIDLLKDLDFLYNFFLLRMKLLLFMIWDIDSYIGNNNYIVCKYDERLKYYSIKADDTLYDFFDKNNFIIEKNHKDLVFYDLENNMEFFDILYMFIGFVPFTENIVEISIRSEPLFQIIKLMENINSRLINLNNSMEWFRGWHFHIKKKEEMDKVFIENNIKDWINLFLKESKIEWEILLKKETISERNWRLLKEIENIFI